MREAKTILAINPGNTSTKMGLVQVSIDENGDVESRLCAEKTVRHPDEELKGFDSVAGQLPYRLEFVRSFLNNFDGGCSIDGVAGRGGLARPMPAGTHETNQALLSDLRAGYQGEHAANLGGLMADAMGKELGTRSFIVDGVSVDEMIPEARISGLPEICRRCLWHSLNCRAVARRAAFRLGASLDEINLVVVHLGSGVTVAALRRGRAIDVNDATAEGPMGPDRAGGLPATGVVDLVHSSQLPYRQLRRKLMSEGGIYAYLGTRDMKEVMKRTRSGDEQVQLLVDAMIYQIGKETGAMSASLKGDVRAIVLTGGMANSEEIVDDIRARIGWIAPVLVIPGEDELFALAQGVWRVLTGREEPAEYPGAE